MKLITGSRYASVTATLALVLAMSGTSYAVTKIDANSVKSKQIKNGAVTAKDLKNGAVTSAKLGTNAVNSAKVADDSLTGADINESTLSSVPKADKAGNADTVGGQSITKISYLKAAVAGEEAIFDKGGLRILASCAAGDNLTLTARTTKDDSEIYSLVVEDSDPENPLQDDYEDRNFDVGDTFNVLVTGDGDIGMINLNYWAQDGTVVTGSLVANESGQGCIVKGHLIAG